MNIATSTIEKPSLLRRLPKELLQFISIIAFSSVVWYTCKPATLSHDAWKLLVIFIATITSLILKPYPMGVIAICAIAIMSVTGSVTLQTSLQGFAYDQLWLIVLACFLARGFIKTGLGKRIAYSFVSLFGGSPYGMGYGLLLSTFCMAPLIPSTTARTGGIILPVLRSIVQVLSSTKTGSDKCTVGAFLTMVVFHGSVVSSALFITANAGNPIVVKFAENMGLEISWLGWAKAAIVPGLLCMALLPPLLSYLAPCKVEDAKKVQTHAQSELKSLGKISWQEKGLLIVFTSLLTLWAFGRFFSVGAADAALLGVSVLLLFNILNWKDILSETLAWDTFIWMGTLIMMASELQNLGTINWFTDHITNFIPAYSWQLQLVIVSLIYYYTHYFFASTAAHISSMYAPFLAVSIAAGAPPMVAALSLGFLSSLFGGMTHYSSGPAPILYAEQHMDIKKWWKIGFIMSTFYLLIWGGVGALWWSFIGIM